MVERVWTDEAQNTLKTAEQLTFENGFTCFRVTEAQKTRPIAGPDALRPWAEERYLFQGTEIITEIDEKTGEPTRVEVPLVEAFSQTIGAPWNPTTESDPAMVPGLSKTSSARGYVGQVLKEHFEFKDIQRQNGTIQATRADGSVQSFHFDR